MMCTKDLCICGKCQIVSSQDTNVRLPDTKAPPTDEQMSDQEAAEIHYVEFKKGAYLIPRETWFVRGFLRGAQHGRALERAEQGLKREKVLCLIAEAKAHWQNGEELDGCFALDEAFAALEKNDE